VCPLKKVLLLGFVCCLLSAAAVSARAAVPQDGKAAAVYYRDGVRYALAGRLAEAAAAFEQAVRLDPKNGDAFFSLGNVYSEQGRWADAVGAYEQAIARRKKDGEAYNSLGLALGHLGEYERAGLAFERAIEIFPDWAEPRFHLSRVYKQLGREVAAQVTYTEALERRPDYAARPPRSFTDEQGQARVANTTAGASNQRAGAVNQTAGAVNRPAPVVSQPPAAVKQPAAAVNQPPAVVNQPASGVSADRASVDSTPRAAAPAESARRAAPSPEADAAALYEAGIGHGRAGRHEQALAALTRAVRLDRNHAPAHAALGETYARLGRGRESVDAFEQAVRLDPRDARAYEMLGRSYAKLRESTPATPGETLRTARESSPTPAGEAAGARAAADSGAASDAGTSAPAADAERPAPVDPDPTAVYRVGPGDVLEVRAPLPGDGRGAQARGAQANAYKVTPTGLLDYPKLGEPLKVEGLTADEVAALVGSELKRRGVSVAPPGVSVGVLEYASHAIIVSGMVKEPGTKILRREGVPLYVIVADAQPLGGAGQAVVVPKATGRVVAVNLQDAAGMRMLVRPGDVVTVRALPQQFYFVAGEVRQPGQREFHFGLTLTQAVLAAGGATRPGASNVALTRQGDDGRLQTTRYSLREIEAGRVPDPALRPGDRVEVLR
jgi:tetratricopeptide (TPR) repeat protein